MVAGEAIGDARTNGRDPKAEVFAQIAEKAGRTFWLNPEPQAYWGSGDSAVTQYAEAVEMVEVRNAVQLEEFVQRLLPQ